MREITLEDMALDLANTVREVQDHRDQLVVVHRGKRVAAVIPIEFYERWFAEREQAFRYFDELPSRELPHTEEEVERDIEQAIGEVRTRKHKA